MKLELKPDLKLMQRLIVTPQLQLAIKLLQLNSLELQDLITTELNENPLLERAEENFLSEGNISSPEELEGEQNRNREERSEDFHTVTEEFKALVDNRRELYSKNNNREDRDDISWENFVSKKSTLYDHLNEQLKLSDLSETDKEIGVTIIGNIDDDGYLRLDLAEIAKLGSISVEKVEKILKKIQEFDPPGVGSRDIKECLILQLKYQKKDEPYIVKIIANHLEDLCQKKISQISRSLKIAKEKVLEAIKIVSSLEPKPGRPFKDEDIRYITPDIYIYRVGNNYEVMLNDDSMPRLKINPAYQNILKLEDSLAPETKEYLMTKLKSAIWFIKSVHQRQRTILKIARSIIKFQRDFFDKGVGHLKPLVLREIAEDINMHESTVSRVTTNKYVHTPHGIFLLKYFFSSAIPMQDGNTMASESIKNKIKEITEKENHVKPLSDQAIADILGKIENVNIARRTVTKYREILGILSSSQRKKIF